MKASSKTKSSQNKTTVYKTKHFPQKADWGEKTYKKLLFLELKLFNLWHITIIERILRNYTKVFGGFELMGQASFFSLASLSNESYIESLVIVLAVGGISEMPT